MERERNRRVGAVRSFPVALMKDPLIDTTAPWAFLTDGNPVFLDEMTYQPIQGKG